MRIIGGELKRRKLASPPDSSQTRPLPDNVRESIFNLLRGHWEGANVLDCFAGTGSFGLEAVSRGAARCVMVERDRRVARVLDRNIEDLGIADRTEVFICDALSPVVIARMPRPIDIAMFDPPYEMVRDPDGWRRVRAQFERVLRELRETGFAMVRTPWPFQHEVRPAPTSDEPVVEQIDLSADGADAALDSFERDLVRASKPQHVDGDLTFASADGPETHVYGTTAVHLYMRKK